MGVTSSIAKGFLGGGKPKSAPTRTIIKQQAPARDTSSDNREQEEEAKRKRIVALNAQGRPGQLTPAGGVQGGETVARKQLLGQ